MSDDERPNRLRAAAEEAMAAGLARSVSIVEQSGMVVVSKAEWEAVQGEVAVLRFQSVADATEIERLDRRILSLRAARPTSLPEAAEPDGQASWLEVCAMGGVWRYPHRDRFEHFTIDDWLTLAFNGEATVNNAKYRVRHAATPSAPPAAVEPEAGAGAS